MLLAAIAHSSSNSDFFCVSPGSFRVRLRSAKDDLKRVTLHFQDKYIPLKYIDTREEKPMEVYASDGLLDYWEAELEMDVICLRYWFELEDQQGAVRYYSNYRFWDEPLTDIDEMFDCPQNLREEDRFLIPAWAENKVIYQVFPSRFAGSGDVQESRWYKHPITAGDDLRGNLRGIIDHLDHIRELGADILYMTPIFRSNSSHKYDTIDYYTIDPSFGTKEDLLELVEKAHAMGIRVILDGVFNHTAPEFFAFADVREKGRDSQYWDWYDIRDERLRAKRGEKPDFKTFGYFGGMPKLNLCNPEAAQYVLDVALYWLRTAGIDGWRLDVGDEIGHRFWKRFRREIKAEFPDALITGEIWHHAEGFLQGDEWDTVMNYPFYQNVLRLAARGQATVSEFANQLGFQRGQTHPMVLNLLWNLIGSHDTPRILTQCGSDKEKLKLAAALQLLLPGMPMIYYGDEYAMEGGKDPDCRRGMLWDPNLQDGEIFRWYQSLIRVRKACPGLLDYHCKTETDDEAALLIRRGKGVTAVFCCGKTPRTLRWLSGRTDLISGKTFDGTIPGFSAAVFADPE